MGPAPELEYGDNLVKVVESPDHQDRVVIFVRNEMFRLRHEYFYRTEYEGEDGKPVSIERWASPRPAETEFYETPTSAEQAADNLLRLIQGKKRD